MARPLHVADKMFLQFLDPLSVTCLTCGKPAHIAYHTQRTVTTLEGRYHLHLSVRRYTSPDCPRYHLPYRLGSLKEHGHYRMENMGWM